MNRTPPPDPQRPAAPDDAAVRPARPRRQPGGPARIHDPARIQRRLARIEGQVRGIGRMVDRQEECIDILQQAAALRAAVDAVTLLILEDHVAACLAHPARGADAAARVDDVMEVVRRSMGRPARTARAGAAPAGTPGGEG